MKKKNNHWNNYDNCYQEAQKYTSRYKFQLGASRAYHYALINNWLDDYIWFKKNYWTEEDCRNEALKYTSFSEFRTKSTGAYMAALKNNWIEQYDFLERKRKPRNYWTYENCYKAAEKFDKITEFEKKYPSAYKKAKDNNWFDDYHWLVDDRVNIITDKIDLVYSYEFAEQKYVYIGRTLMRRKVARDWEHIFEKNDAVSCFAKQNGISVPEMKVLESDLTIKEGVEKESFYIEKYKSEGWILLNKAKAGSIGTIAKGRWNKKTCYEEALKYTTKSDFRQNSCRAYEYARQSGWLKDYYWLGKKQRKLKGSKYTYEVCFELAKECAYRANFEHKYPQAYKISKSNKWINDYTWFRSGREVRWDNNRKHTYESCYAEAKKYTKLTDYYYNSKISYNVAKKNNWLKDYTWLEQDRKRRGYWNSYENCYNEALKYSTRSEFKSNCGPAYYSSMKNGWINDFTWIKKLK